VVTTTNVETKPLSPEAKFDRFKIEWILIRDLLPHPRVQRPFNEKHAHEIGTHFDPDKFRPLDVIPAPRGGRFYVFAGQHRLGGARIALGEDQRVPCHVHDAETPLRQLAAICLGVDDMLNWRPLDRWKLRLLSQEDIPTKIDAMLTRHNLSVKYQGGVRVVRAVAALEEIWVRHGGELALDRVLRVLGAAWGDDKDAFDGLLLRGLGLLFHRLGDQVRDDVLVEKMRRHIGPARLIGQARDFAKAAGITNSRATAEKLAAVYNAGLRQGRLNLENATASKDHRPNSSKL